ncbi:MAG TPA: hypothetical protein VKB86_11830 [Pyrinomonadaceae bacterium]|nr:hypothetical protein [Pyrinomonadaceae bacterium]
MCQPDQAQIKHDVLSYLIKNRDAQDTLEGIIEWWLLERKIERQTAAVKKVLDELATSKLLVEYRAGDSQTHYRVNHRKEKEILALLKRRD